MSEVTWKSDLYLLRATDAEGRSLHPQANGFTWPQEVGAEVQAPDWDPDPNRGCGGGLHGLPDGLGDWGLLPAPSSGCTIWWVVEARRDEAIFSDGKARVPRCRVVYFGALAGAMELVAPRLSAATLALVKERCTAATPEGASATGWRGAASATGESGAASATGGRGAASATGGRGAAIATGDDCTASATGDHGVAVAAGYRSCGMAAEGCLLVLVERDDEGRITNHYAGIVGTRRKCKPGVWYEMRDGRVCEVERGTP